MASRKGKARPKPVPSLVRDLVDQFDRPLDFYRELIQNSIDAGANRVDVTLEHDGERALIRVEDDGSGMDERTVDGFLLVLFRSTKEEDFTKIGKFGMGFVSVFALRPELVRVTTAKDDECWRVDLLGYKRYEKQRHEEPREGTLVEIRKRMPAPGFEELCRGSLESVRYWCRHSETRVFFAAGAERPAQVNGPFALEGSSLRHVEEGTEVLLAFSGEEKPFYGFYNRGMTVKEGRKAFFPGVALKAKSRYLEHTLTRDDVLVNDKYDKLMAIMRRLVRDELAPRVRGELERAKDPRVWEERLPFLRGLFKEKRPRRGISEWGIFPCLSGARASLAEVRKGLRAGGNKLCHDAAPNRITAALRERGVPVLASGPWVGLLAELLGAPAVRASEAFIAPEVVPDKRLPDGLKDFLVTLRRLDRRSGPKYQGIAAADFAEHGSALKERMFATQKKAGELSPAEERPVSSILWLKPARRWALLSAGHPAVLDLARLHASRPGLAAYLALKIMYLNDGEVPPDRKGEFSNLAERAELELLKEALTIDERREA